MKIAIVGTSNSRVKDGWVKYYKELNPAVQIDNYSLGANNSFYVHYILEKKDILANYDYCILDLAVNDQEYLTAGSVSEELLLASYLDLMRKLKQASCIPIILILPSIEDYYHRPLQSNIRKHIVFLCQEFGVFYLDVYDFIENLNMKYPEICCMRDSNHITSFVGKIVAELITGCYFQARATFTEKITDNPISFNFCIVPSSNVQFSNYKPIIRQNSVAKFEVMQAQTVDSIIQIHGDDLLCGMFFYSTPTTHCIYLQADVGTIRKNITTFWKNIFFLAVFAVPVKPRDFAITIHLACNEKALTEGMKTFYEPQVYVPSDLEVVDFLICDKLYASQVGMLKAIINKNTTSVIYQTHEQQLMATEFKNRFYMMDEAIVDDLIRYQRGNIEPYQSEKRLIGDFIASILHLVHDKHTAFVLFGAGGIGQALLGSNVLNKGLISYIVDNDANKWGLLYEDIVVFEPAILFKDKGKKVLVACSAYSEVKAQLEGMGLSENIDFFDICPLYQLINYR